MQYVLCLISEMQISPCLSLLLSNNNVSVRSRSLDQSGIELPIYFFFHSHHFSRHEARLVLLLQLHPILLTALGANIGLRLQKLIYRPFSVDILTLLPLEGQELDFFSQNRWTCIRHSSIIADIESSFLIKPLAMSTS